MPSTNPIYFKSRVEAGKQIADQLKHYKTQNCVVVALSEGAVVVGAQIAIKLHTNLALLLSEKITIPGEPNPLAAITSTGTFTYNNMFSVGELEEFASEYHSFIDQDRQQKMHKLNKLIGRNGEINKETLKRHVIILVSDGLNSGFSLDVAADFLKPLAIKRLIIATPIASVAAVDRMHLGSDEICCLSVPKDYISTDHYYEDNKLPSSDEIKQIINNIPLNWTNPLKG